MSRPWRKQGFTLIELLVVIAIIAVLMALIVPAVKTALDRGKESAARAAVLGIETAWKTYFQEYGKWPLGNRNEFMGNYGGEDQVSLGIPVDEYVVAMLTGDPQDRGGNKGYRKEVHNPKGIVFLEINEQSIAPHDHKEWPGAFLDPWGQPYRFLFDSNYDNRVKHNKWHTASDDSGIAKSVIVWSTGPDMEGDSKTERLDDIVSW